MFFGKGIGEGVRTLMKDFRPPAFDPEQSIYPMEVLDVQPKALIQPAPAYPTELKQARVEGNVSVIFIVSENGKVGSISIKNATHREFAISVREALRRTNFEPGKIDNTPVPTRVRQVFNFNLRK